MSCWVMSTAQCCLMSSPSNQNRLSQLLCWHSLQKNLLLKSLLLQKLLPCGPSLSSAPNLLLPRSDLLTLTSNTSTNILLAGLSEEKTSIISVYSFHPLPPITPKWPSLTLKRLHQLLNHAFSSALRRQTSPSGFLYVSWTTPQHLLRTTRRLHA